MEFVRRLRAPVRATVAIEKAIDELEVARPTASCADSEFARQMRFCTGGESRNLFVPDMHPLNFVLSANRIGEAVQAVTNNTVDAFHFYCAERLGKLICNGLHGIPPCYTLREVF